MVDPAAPLRTVARRWSIVAGGLLLALLWMFSTAVPADAHAQVRSTFPVDGAALEDFPAEVSLAFNEGVDVPTAGLRVFDQFGERIDHADASVDPDDSTRIRAAISTDVEPGTFVVTWRAVSADGHPIKGAWVYSVGAGSQVGEELLAALFEGSSDTGVALASIVVRVLAVVGALGSAGVLLFMVLVGRRSELTDDEVARLRGVARLLAVVAGAAALVSVPVQAMLTTGLGVSALAMTPLLDVIGDPFGLSSVARAVLFGVLVVALGRSSSDAAGMPRALLGVAVVGVVAFAAEGHSLTQEPLAVIFTADLVHLLAAAAWSGGLLAFVLVLRGRTRRDDPVAAARVVGGFSSLATWSLLAVVVAGSAMSWVTVRAARALTTTDYGWTLLAKVAVVMVVIVLGLYNNRVLVPAVMKAASVDPGTAGDDRDDRAARVADAGWARLRTTGRFELVGMALVIGLTAALVGQQPASQEAGVTGAYSTYVELGAEHDVNMVVDPNVVGQNEIHFYVLDRTGRPFDAESIRVLLTQPELGIGPIERLPTVAGPGHWTIIGRELAVAGEWVAEVVVRIGRFDEARVEIPFVVN